MAEQQLIDYIKKAREAGQSDDQTKSLLLKNGWTDAEINDALAPLQPQVKPQPQVQPAAVVMPKIEAQPENLPLVQAQPQVQTQPKVQPQVQAQPKAQPQVQTQPQVQVKTQPAQVTQMAQTRKSHTGLKILISLVIILILCGVGYFVAGQYITLPWNPFTPSPATVLSKMEANMQNVKSSHMIMAGEIDATDGSKTSVGKLAFNVENKSDITDINNPKANATFSIELTMPASTSVTATVSANANIIVVGKALYFQISDITSPAAFSSYYDVSQFKGKWFKFDQDSLTVLSQAEPGQVPASISQADNSAITKKIQALVLSENMLSVSKQLGSETISGQDTYHYLVTISEAKLKDLITKIVALEMPASAGTSSLSSNMVTAFVNTFADAVGDINMEMWIGKKDYLLYKTSIDKIIDLSKISSGANVQIEVKSVTTNSDFNKPVTVQAPDGAQKIEDVVLPLLKPQKVKSDMEQLMPLAESSFTTTNGYSSLCSHNLFNGYLATYGSELINLNNDIVAQGAKKPICFASANNYCISTQLADGTYLCTDQTGIIGTTKCLSAQTVCK